MGENWWGKELGQLVGIVIFVWGNIQQMVAGLVCEWVETLESQDCKESPMKYCNKNGDNRKVRLSEELLPGKKLIHVSLNKRALQ
ncbi:MAG: hypothetical protein WCI31_16355 [Prolixibacteraceae bacterium]